MHSPLIAAACGGDDDDDDANGGDGAETSEDAGDGGDDAGDGGEDAGDGGEDGGEDAGDGGDDAGDGGDDMPEEEHTASDIGVSEDTITMAAVIADLSGLRDIGFDLPEALTNQHLVDRYQVYADEWNAAGGINGRMVEFVEVNWDPLDPATMQDACNELTLDLDVFMAVNASGFSQTFIPCIVEDGDMLFFYGEVVSQQLIDAAPNRLFALNPTSEIAGAAGAQLAVDQGLLPDGEKVGILSTNNLAIQAATESALEIIEGAGFETVTVEVNTLSDDNAAINAEAAAAVSTFNAEGVGHVFVLPPFTQATGFWSEVGALQPEWGRTMIDSASSNCTPFGASRTTPAAEGAVCVTAYSSYALPDGGLRADEEFEAQCRQEWIDHFPVLEGNSNPGVPSGEVALEDAAGNLLYSDYPPGECTMMMLLEQALTNAGANPTRDSVAEQLKSLSGAQAFRSNGEGAFGPDKNYYSTQMQAVQFTLAGADTVPGDDGTYNGCPAPVNCWIPVTGEWFEIG